MSTPPERSPAVETALAAEATVEADVDAAPATGTAVAGSLGAIQRAAIRGSWWTAVQAALGMPLGVVANLVVARSLGPHEYGRLASYIAAFSLLLVVLNAGVSDATVQWGAAAVARSQRSQLLELIRRCAGFHLFVETPAAAIAAVILLHDESPGVQLVGALSIALTMALGTTTVALTATGRNAALAKLSLVVGLGVQLAVVTTAVQTGDAGAVWAARLAVSVLATAGALFVADPDVRRASLRPLPPWHWPAGFARFSRGTVAATLITTLVFSRCEVLVLDGMGRSAAAGLFALAAGLAVQITAPVDAMLAPLLPAAAGLLALDRSRAATATLRGIRLSALATAPLMVLVVPAVAILTPLIYGHDFATTGELFVALGLVSGLQSVLHPVTAFVAALRRPLLTLGFDVVALVVDLGLVIGLVVPFGAVGAVVGNSAGQLVSLALSTWLLRRELGLGLRPTAVALAPFVALSAGVVVACVVGLSLAGHGAVLATVSGLVVSIVLGAAALRLGRGGVTESDLGGIRDGFPRAGAVLLAVSSRFGLVRPTTDQPTR